ncbi:hypothetical protein AU255_03370 [Methyloprofundus sedimenti]|uniref:Methylated-DNA-[protein]-cysteine S-methyltransferase DNA binding domain-containing protein n=1 Tax=Methyloprofundus sedimenti TaxID=1420851 RepID=A0A1V8M6D5_9GAMM|nr:methylated-DNA--[protein]-cysteine S-methyltransferase [Methyloprofundus sedimenti]OQK16953.1 hypothetical protein AU255_03370 [Methyloprofundus sedimenti]
MSHSQLNWQTLEKPEPLLTYCYTTPAGSLAIQMRGKLLCKLQWLLAPPLEAERGASPTALEQQLNHYWLTGKIAISTALLQQGTEFQHKVWRALSLIPLGQTRTYGELAKELDTSPRALANACRQNPFPVIIPCHRVLAMTGIGGYAGASTGKLVKIKAALLQHEKMLIHDI